MSYYCKLCDKTMKNSTKYKHNKSRYHIAFSNAIICRYIILNPDFDKFEEIMRKYVIIQNKEYDEYRVYC